MWATSFPSFQSRHLNKQINLNSSHCTAFFTQELCKSWIHKSISFRTFSKKYSALKDPLSLIIKDGFFSMKNHSKTIKEGKLEYTKAQIIILNMYIASIVLIIYSSYLVNVPGYYCSSQSCKPDRNNPEWCIARGAEVSIIFSIFSSLEN